MRLQGWMRHWLMVRLSDRRRDHILPRAGECLTVGLIDGNIGTGTVTSAGNGTDALTVNGA